MTGAILWLTRPAMIIRSAWRGEARKTSIPNRATSNRGVPAAIISIAQHASPKVTGHIDEDRTQPARSSTFPSRKPEGIFSSRPMVVYTSLVPVQPTTAPFVNERHGDEEQERQHSDEPEHGEFPERHRPRVKKNDLDVEDDEGHRDEVVLDRKPNVGRVPSGLDPALVGVNLDPVGAFGADDGRGGHPADSQRRGQTEHDQDGNKRICHSFFLTPPGRFAIVR